MFVEKDLDRPISEFSQYPIRCDPPLIFPAQILMHLKLVILMQFWGG